MLSPAPFYLEGEFPHIFKQIIEMDIGVIFLLYKYTNNGFCRGVFFVDACIRDILRNTSSVSIFTLDCAYKLLRFRAQRSRLLVVWL